MLWQFGKIVPNFWTKGIVEFVEMISCFFHSEVIDFNRFCFSKVCLWHPLWKSMRTGSQKIVDSPSPKACPERNILVLKFSHSPKSPFRMLENSRF